MKTSELTGVLLDYWVARAEGLEVETGLLRSGLVLLEREREYYYPSSDWETGGPIIERELIELHNDRGWREDGEFGRVWQGNDPAGGYWDGDTPLIAAMRAFVAGRFGAEVPDEG